MTKQEEQFRETLEEILELDKTDLDFGVYRIMNAKREQILQFLNRDLIPGVRKAIGESTPNLAQKEEEVFSHLHRFFKRYYDEGDFISKRRYKEGVYAIPYEGEEVKLYWANHDQYYIKSTENLLHYRFTLPSGERIEFRITESPLITDNKKADAARLLTLADQPGVKEEGTFVLRFAWKLTDKANKKKDTDAIRELAEAILGLPDVGSFKTALAMPLPGATAKKKGDVTRVIDRHLRIFISQHKFDYFIHKDLGGFLRRELDYYLKTEVMHLENLNTASEIQAEQYLDVLRAIKKVGENIITFLAQLEDFQKKLWLKKKFVYETHYCSTLDRVPEEFYAEIAGNSAQVADWQILGFISEQDTKEGRLSADFLKAHSNLVLDTRHFSPDFKDRWVARLSDMVAQVDGLLIHGENFQALNLIMQRYRAQVTCTYIDPPYNAQSSQILYKNQYRDSSWLSLIADRLSASTVVQSPKGVLVIAIDEVEQEHLGELLRLHFPGHERSCVVVNHNPSGQQSDNISYTHEYQYFVYPKPGRFIAEQLREDPADWDERNFRDVTGNDSLRAAGPNCFYPIVIKGQQVHDFGDICPTDFHPSTNETNPDGTISVYPIDPEGIERKWRFARDTVESIKEELKVHYLRERDVYDIKRLKKKFNYKSNWFVAKYSANNHGTQLLNQMIPGAPASYPKSLYTVVDALTAATNEEPNALVLDYFAGSGTTAHAVLYLNRKGGDSLENRRYILVEVNDYFDTVLKPRIMKTVFAEKWEEGKPILAANGKLSHAFKYIRIESYEDTLNNLEITQLFNDNTTGAPTEYVLSYMLDTETQDSASILKPGYLVDPFNYQMKITRNNELAWRKIDLIETFNWLLGIKVKRQRMPITLQFRFEENADGRVIARMDKGKETVRYQVVEGETLEGETVMVCWRTLIGGGASESLRQNDAALEAFLGELQKSASLRTEDFDFFYVNGDCSVKGALLLEDHFRRLMFAGTQG